MALAVSMLSPPAVEAVLLAPLAAVVVFACGRLPAAPKGAKPLWKQGLEAAIHDQRGH